MGISLYTTKSDRDLSSFLSAGCSPNRDTQKDLSCSSLRSALKINSEDYHLSKVFVSIKRKGQNREAIFPTLAEWSGQRAACGLPPRALHSRSLIYSVFHFHKQGSQEAALSSFPLFLSKIFRSTKIKSTCPCFVNQPAFFPRHFIRCHNKLTYKQCL